MRKMDSRDLVGLVPINALTRGNFEELARKVNIQSVPAGKMLFQIGETDRHAIYVLAGEVELRDDNGAEIIKGGSQQARHALGPQQPRQQVARAKTDCTVALVDRDLLDVLLTWDQSSGIEVEEIDGTEGDWMTRLLQTKSIMLLPAANIQALFLKLERVQASVGDVIIRQDDEGDYYYIISEGQCQVTQHSLGDSEDMILAKLVAGDAFGEEALISEDRRNATVTMLTDGVLMRLDKGDFLELMKEPLHSMLTYPEACELAEEGAGWLDVRLASEYSKGHLPNSLNVPLFHLRKKADSIDKDKSYIIVCDTGRRSATAAFLLAERGFDVHVLQGGLSTAPKSVSAA